MLAGGSAPGYGVATRPHGSWALDDGFWHSVTISLTARYANAVPGCHTAHQMSVEGRVAGSGSSVAQGIADMAQSWVHLARDMAPQVPELPGIIQQQVAALNGTEITEERLNEVARAITKRVDDAGHPEVAATLLRRMGRAMYELLLLLATEEELRTMGMLMEVAAVPAPKPPAPAPPPESPRPVSAAPTAPPPTAQQVQQRPQPSGQPLQGVSVSGQAAPPAPTVPKPPEASPQGVPAIRATATGRVEAGRAEAPPSLEQTPRAAPPPTAAPVAKASEAAGPPVPQPSPPQQDRVPPAGNAVVEKDKVPPQANVIEEKEAVPKMKPPAGSAEEEAILWGFDPAARAVEEVVSAPIEAQTKVPEDERPEPALAVESTPAKVASAPSAGAAGLLGLGNPRGWTVRLSPRAAQERERRLAKRLVELPALVEEISNQVHEQRRAVSDRGTAKQAVRAAAEQSAPSDLQVAGSRIGDLLEGGRLPDAAALALRAAEAFPGEASAELACRAGEASRHGKDDELATLCFTTAVLAAPPCEAACWQLAGMALEQRDPRLAPIWMEFLARLLRVRGADEDAVVVYRQLLSLTPRRQDVRDILRLASLTGVLPD